MVHLLRYTKERTLKKMLSKELKKRNIRLQNDKKKLQHQYPYNKKFTKEIEKTKLVLSRKRKIGIRNHV